MKRGRPPKPETPYIMKIHKDGKYLYASTQRRVHDGSKNFQHIHWGTVKDGVFIPNARFLYLEEKEKQKFIFPDDWDLSEWKNQQVAVPAPIDTSVITVETMTIAVAHSRFYGAVWLMERISDRLGVRQDLMVTFCYNQVLVDDIMTIAMFLFIANINLDRLEEWQSIEKYPSPRTLSSSVITELEKGITEQNRIDFLKLRKDRIGKDAVLAVDSTSKSGFGTKLIDLSWGKTRRA